MSEDEELPQILLNTSVSSESTFSMPSADVVASQRARELECEQELRQLREEMMEEEEKAPEGRRVHKLCARSDSSGSESEALLAAAVTSLNVWDTSQSPHHAPLAAQLLAALAEHAGPGARPLIDQPDIIQQLPEVVGLLGAMLSVDDDVWSDEDVCAAGALLASAALAHDSRVRAAALRALHALLDQRASDQQVQQVGDMLLSAVRSGRARLELSDALQTGSGGGADRLAARVLDVALLELLGGSAELGLEAALTSGWRNLAPPEGYLVVQLLGRRLARGGAEREERVRLLTTLTLPPHTAAHDAQHPDTLKVRVAASKLHLLFRADK